MAEAKHTLYGVVLALACSSVHVPAGPPAKAKHTVWFGSPRAPAGAVQTSFRDRSAVHRIGARLLRSQTAAAKLCLDRRCAERSRSLPVPVRADWSSAPAGAEHERQTTRYERVTAAGSEAFDLCASAGKPCSRGPADRSFGAARVATTSRARLCTAGGEPNHALRARGGRPASEALGRTRGEALLVRAGGSILGAARVATTSRARLCTAVRRRNQTTRFERVAVAQPSEALGSARGGALLVRAGESILGAVGPSNETDRDAQAAASPRVRRRGRCGRGPRRCRPKPLEKSQAGGSRAPGRWTPPTHLPACRQSEVSSPI